jgi:hypothetical protein
MKAFVTGGTEPTVVSVDIKDELDWFRDEGMLV